MKKKALGILTQLNSVYLIADGGWYLSVICANFKSLKPRYEAESNSRDSCIVVSVLYAGSAG
jgi:hypothetical protein